MFLVACCSTLGALAAPPNVMGLATPGALASLPTMFLVARLATVGALASIPFVALVPSCRANRALAPVPDVHLTFFATLSALLTRLLPGILANLPIM